MASVVLAGLIASLKLVGGTLAEHTFLFLGAGEAGIGIAELIAIEMSKQTGAPLEETRKKIWLVDSKGLIVKSRLELLQHFKKPWAREHEPVQSLLDAVKVIKPTVLIGSSGAGRTFTKEVIQAMASFNEKPIILALSIPTSQSNVQPKKLIDGVRAEPFSPVVAHSLLLNIMGLLMHLARQTMHTYSPDSVWVIISGAIRVHDGMLLVASEALASQVSQENLDKGLVYPPFANIRKISIPSAAKACELGLATRLPQRENVVAYAESFMYNPNYRKYR